MDVGSMPEVTYKVSHNGDIFGPFRIKQLAGGLKAGKVTIDTEVCEIDGQRWISLGQLLNSQKEWFDVGELLDRQVESKAPPSKRFPKRSGAKARNQERRESKKTPAKRPPKSSRSKLRKQPNVASEEQMDRSETRAEQLSPTQSCYAPSRPYYEVCSEYNARELERVKGNRKKANREVDIHQPTDGNYYVENALGSHGPLSMAELREMASSGKLTFLGHPSHIRQGKNGNWVLATKVPGLEFGNNNEIDGVEQPLPKQPYQEICRLSNARELKRVKSNLKADNHSFRGLKHENNREVRLRPNDVTFKEFADALVGPTLCLGIALPLLLAVFFSVRFASTHLGNGDSMVTEVPLGTAENIAIKATTIFSDTTDEVSGGKKRSVASGGNSPGDKITAWIMAKIFVKRDLKSPGSASFGGLFTDRQDPKSVVTSLGGGKYRVNAWVDADNSFGATIRTPFVCELKYAGGDNWQCTDLVMLEGGSPSSRPKREMTDQEVFDSEIMKAQKEWETGNPNWAEDY